MPRSATAAASPSRCSRSTRSWRPTSAAGSATTPPTRRGSRAATRNGSSSGSGRARRRSRRCTPAARPSSRRSRIFRASCGTPISVAFSTSSPPSPPPAKNTSTTFTSPIARRGSCSTRSSACIPTPRSSRSSRRTNRVMDASRCRWICSSGTRSRPMAPRTSITAPPCATRSPAPARIGRRRCGSGAGRSRSARRAASGSSARSICPPPGSPGFYRCSRRGACRPRP